MGRTKESRNHRTDRLMVENGITETKYHDGLNEGYRYEQFTTGEEALVFSSYQQSAAKLPWKAETDDWLGYFATRAEAQLAAVEALSTEGK